MAQGSSNIRPSTPSQSMPLYEVTTSATYPVLNLGWAMPLSEACYIQFEVSCVC